MIEAGAVFDTLFFPFDFLKVLEDKADLLLNDKSSLLLSIDHDVDRAVDCGLDLDAIRELPGCSLRRLPNTPGSLHD